MTVRSAFRNLSRSMYSMKDRAGNLGSKVVDYIATSPVYHTLTAATFPAVAGLYSISAQGVPEKVVAAVGTLAIAAYLQNLAKRRYRQYNEMKTNFEQNGYSEEEILPHLRPWFCERYAARRAARKTGFSEEIERTIKGNNIKWYHLGPRNPLDWIKTANNDPIFSAIGKVLKRA